jgi:uncharacterized damage-inducible protein DinB
MDPLILMYEWVKQTHEVLFEYTDNLPNDVYTLEHPDFAYGSIRNIQAHVAGCYQFWVGAMGLQQTISYVDEPASSLPDAQSMRAAFTKVDLMLEEAFEKFQSLDEPLQVVRPGRDVLMVSQRWLITHPITHEFHHKGQLLALGRVLGHPLSSGMDTDLVLP